MIISGIYKITNTITNDFYIGSSKNIKSRIFKHFSTLKNNKHYSKLLQNVYNKYGKQNFKYEILEKVEDIKNLYIVEQHYLDTLTPRYNLSKIANYVPKNKKEYPKIYQYNLDGTFIKKWNSLIEIETFYNKNMKHITCCLKSKRKSAYNFQWSNSNIFNNIVKPKNKKVALYDNDILLKEYNTLNEAGKDLGVSYVMIRNYCNGNYSISKKFNNNYTIKFI